MDTLSSFRSPSRGESYPFSTFIRAAPILQQDVVRSTLRHLARALQRLKPFAFTHPTRVNEKPMAVASQSKTQKLAGASLNAADDIAALRAIVEGTAHSTGEEFFQSLVKNLAAAINAQYAFVAEFAEVNTRARTIAFWAKDYIRENLEWELAGTPCEDVVGGKLCHHPSGIRQRFPHDRPMVEMGIDSYLGAPMLDSEQKVLGHLAVFDERPMPPEPRRLFIFRIFAARRGGLSKVRRRPRSCR